MVVLMETKLFTRCANVKICAVIAMSHLKLWSALFLWSSLGAGKGKATNQSQQAERKTYVECILRLEKIPQWPRGPQHGKCGGNLHERSLSNTGIHFGNLRRLADAMSESHTTPLASVCYMVTLLAGGKERIHIDVENGAISACSPSRPSHQAASFPFAEFARRRAWDRPWINQQCESKSIGLRFALTL